MNIENIDDFLASLATKPEDTTNTPTNTLETIKTTTTTTPTMAITAIQTSTPVVSQSTTITTIPTTITPTTTTIPTTSKPDKSAMKNSILNPTGLKTSSNLLFRGVRQANTLNHTKIIPKGVAVTTLDVKTTKIPTTTPTITPLTLGNIPTPTAVKRSYQDSNQDSNTPQTIQTGITKIPKHTEFIVSSFHTNINPSQLSSSSNRNSHANVINTNINSTIKTTTDNTPTTTHITSKLSNSSKTPGKNPLNSTGRPDDTLADWPENDFRIFVGNLGNEVTDEMLAKFFQHYASFAKARVARDRLKKPKGFGFVSFLQPLEMARALREMDGKYCGSRPVMLKSAQKQQQQEIYLQKEDSSNTRGKDTIKKIKKNHLY